MSSGYDVDSKLATSDEALTLSDVWQLVLRRWKFVMSFALATAFCTAIIVLLIPNKYTASSTILPAPSDFRTRGILALSEGVPGMEMAGFVAGDKSPSMLYPEILKSKLLAEDILKKQYKFSKGNKIITTDLYQYFKTDNPDRAYQALQKITSIEYDKKTAIVEISVTTEDPRLSADIANYYVERLDEFNKYKRKTGAGLNREFIEGRIAEAKEELGQAEDMLKKFREDNRNYYRSTDPELLMYHDRLLREVKVKTQVYLTLAEQYELAAIQEKKELPLIQVLDVAKPPTLKSGPARAKTTLLGLFMGLMAASLFVIAEKRWSLIKVKDTEVKGFIRKFRMIHRPPKVEKVEHVEHVEHK